MNILKTERVFGLELKLMLLGINLLLLLEVNAAKHNLLLLLEVNVARHNLLLLLKVNVARHKLATAGERFEQIVDFLNAHTIKYALTVNPTIYTSFIEQFWATVKAKTVNREVQLQALVDEKKIIITELIVRRDLQLEDAEGVDCILFWATVKAKTVNKEVQLQALVDEKKIIITELIVRRDLQLEDVEGVDCLPNATIFQQLTLMGAKTTVWNDFSSTMASAIICLATNQKFNFSKYTFESMVKNLDNAGNILMYPRNMRRVEKGFSGRETPLFQTMMVQDQEEMGEGSEMPTDPHHIPTIIQPSTSQPQKKQRSRRSKRKNTEVPQPSGPTTNVVDEAVNEEMDDSLERVSTTATTGLDA
ncbi:hypothetical protein Tco_0270542 [Tanacetum coccineum]